MSSENKFIKIKQALIKSVIDFTPEYFKPYLDSEQVKFDAISDEAFYEFFRRIDCTAEANSIGELTLRIEDPRSRDEGKRFSFYDEVHLHPRLNITIVEHEVYIFMEVMPF